MAFKNELSNKDVMNRLERADPFARDRVKGEPEDKLERY